MAAGKTSVGRRVARRLGVAFIDTDKRIVAEHGPIPGIFAEQGRPTSATSSGRPWPRRSPTAV
nr:shikimate kinase [Microbacterium sp. Se63.02b]